MNFAQLIDPEWVQARFPQRHSRRQPAPRPPLGTFTVQPRDEDEQAQKRPKHPGVHNGAAHSVLHVFATATAPMCCWEIAERLPRLTAQKVSNSLFCLRARDRVTRTGPRGNYAYSITAEGRKSV